MLAPDLRDQPLPERDRLRVRVVHAEDLDAALDPREHDVAQRVPEPAPVVRSEVDVVDVLVALGRVLRVLQRAVGAPVEPLGVLGQPRVVRRRLDREVDADLAADLAAARDHALELLERAEVGMHGLVPALRRADRPGAPDVVGLRRERVVPPLAVRRPDRVHRREVGDVEAELRELGKHALDPGEAAEGAREELVPRAERATLAVDVELERLRRRLLAAVARLRLERLLDREGAAFEERRTLGELRAQVFLPRLVLAPDLPLVRRDPVEPRLDPVRPPARLVHLEAALETVVADRAERRLLPARRARTLEADGGAEHLVAVARDRRRDVDPVTGDRLDRVPSAVHLRPHVLDQDA